MDFLRQRIARIFCSAALFGSACTRAPVAEPVPITPEQPVPPPPAATKPEKPLGLLGENPGCATMRVFEDGEDLCMHGIQPLHPFGRCERLPRTNDEVRRPEVHADENQVAALGGTAELYVRHFVGPHNFPVETIYLALRGKNGLVLLASIARYDGLTNAVPEFESFVGTQTSIDLKVRQTWWGLQGSHEEHDRVTNVRCTLAEDGGIRCIDSCPELAPAKPLPPLDCGALAGFDWDTLPRGMDTTDEWEGQLDEDQQRIAMLWIGIEDEDPDRVDPPERVRLAFPDGHFGAVTILEVERGKWVLMHGQVPLLASTRAIRVGKASGGWFVSSWSGDARAIKRLNLYTNELEDVFPGACSEHSSK